MATTNAVIWNEDLVRGEQAQSVNRRRCAFIREHMQEENNTFHILAGNRTLIVQPYEPAVHRNRVVRAYREIWYYADAYRELFSLEDAQDAIDELTDCFIALNELDDVVGLAGGKPLCLCDDLQLLASVEDGGDSVYYFAELGRVPSVRGTRIGTFLFELTMLKAILIGFREFVLCTAEFADISSPSQLNPTRKLYEGHGYQLVHTLSRDVLVRECSQDRAGGKRITDWRPYYHCMAQAFLEAMGLDPAILDAESLP